MIEKSKNKINELKLGVVLSYIQIGIGVIISFLYTPMLLRLLGQNEYGLYSLVASLMGYLSVLSFGFGGSYVKFFSVYKVKSEYGKIAKLNGMYFLFFCCIAILSSLIGILFYINSNSMLGNNLTPEELEKGKLLIGILIFYTAFSFPDIVFKNYILANEKFIFQRSLNLALTILNPCIIIIVLFAGYKSVGMAFYTTISMIIINIIHASFCLKKANMKLDFKDWDFSLFKEIFVFSSYIFISIITVNINWNLDRYVIGRFCGTASVAIYSIGALFNMHYMDLSKTISNVFIPKVNKLIASNKNDLLTYLFTRVGRIQFFIMIFILSCYILYGKKFINLWAGDKYDGAYLIGLVLMMSVLIPSIQTLGIQIQRAKNIHKFRSVVFFMIALGNIGVSIPLTLRYGGLGAAMGTAFAQIIGECIIMNIYYHKKVRLDMFYFWKSILKITPAIILPFLLGAAMNFLANPDNIVFFIGKLLVFALLFFTSMWLLALNVEEKNLIIVPLRSLKNKIRKKYA